jgi:proline iminopeptidase
VLAATLARAPDALDEAALERHAGEPWYAEARAALEQEEDGAYATDEETAALAHRMFPLYFARFGEREARWLDEIREPMNADALRQFNADVPDLRPDLASISAPTLVAAGRHDFLCGPAVAREIAAGIENAEVVPFAESGHFLYVEEPERFRETVWTFLGV